jgi:hypothetical protein
MIITLKVEQRYHAGNMDSGVMTCRTMPSGSAVPSPSKWVLANGVGQSFSSLPADG